MLWLRRAADTGSFGASGRMTSGFSSNPPDWPGYRKVPGLFFILSFHPRSSSLLGAGDRRLGAADGRSGAAGAAWSSLEPITACAVPMTDGSVQPMLRGQARSGGQRVQAADRRFGVRGGQRCWISVGPSLRCRSCWCAEPCAPRPPAAGRRCARSARRAHARACPTSAGARHRR